VIHWQDMENLPIFILCMALVNCHRDLPGNSCCPSFCCYLFRQKGFAGCFKTKTFIDFCSAQMRENEQVYDILLLISEIS